VPANLTTGNGQNNATAIYSADFFGHLQFGTLLPIMFGVYQQFHRVKGTTKITKDHQVKIAIRFTLACTTWQEYVHTSTSLKCTIGLYGFIASCRQLIFFYINV
jgi:hypothetical protein